MQTFWIVEVVKVAAIGHNGLAGEMKICQEPLLAAQLPV